MQIHTPIVNKKKFELSFLNCPLKLNKIVENGTNTHLLTSGIQLLLKLRSIMKHIFKFIQNEILITMQM